MMMNNKSLATVNNDLITFNPEQMDLIRTQIARGCTDDELKLFCAVSKRSGLDPFSHQIHAIKRWSKSEGREIMSIMTGIDGYRLIAQRSGACAGIDDAKFEMANDRPVSATVTVYKMLSNQRCPFTATAYWDEYFPGEKQGFLWKTKPRVMLGKCAEALALRKAFPQELSGIYTREEMEMEDARIVDAKEIATFAENMDYKLQDEQLSEINRLSKEITQGMDAGEKGAWLKKVWGVSHPKELKKKSNEFLAELLEVLTETQRVDSFPDVDEYVTNDLSKA